MVNLTWDEFIGNTIAPHTTYTLNSKNVYNGWQQNAYSGVGATASHVGFKQIPTTGSIVCLDMARFVPLPAEFDAPGSIGQYSLQVQVTATNPHKDTWNGAEFELVVLVVNSGVLIAERGSSSTYIGLLTKADVLETAEQQDFVTHSRARHLVGGSFLGSLKNGLHWVSQHISPVKEFLKQHVNHPVANTMVKTAEALGYGMTAAGNKLQSRLM